MERKLLNKELCDNGDTSLTFLVPPQISKIPTATSLLMLTSLFQYNKDHLPPFFFPPNNLDLFRMEELGSGNAPSSRYAK